MTGAPDMLEKIEKIFLLFQIYSKKSPVIDVLTLKEFVNSAPKLNKYYFVAFAIIE